MADMPQPSQSEERRVKNEELFRDFNVKTSQSIEPSMDEETKNTFPLGMVCECSNPNCNERIELTVAQRKKVRKAAPNLFIIAPGHEDAEIERVVERHQSYAIVQKLPFLAR